jgi:hypothetical protein
VFALGSRSERLFAGLRRVWLREGPISMIAGPDLATSTIEPHELLLFLRGRTRDQFIARGADVDRRLATEPDRTAPDGRHRVHEYFCTDHTWRPTMQRLAARCDAVLMDLRAFSPARQGCIWELTHLLESVDLDRVLLVVDGSTDEAFLETTLQGIFARADDGSANRQRADAAMVTIFRCGRAAEHDLDPMLASLLRHAPGS